MTNAPTLYPDMEWLIIDTTISAHPSGGALKTSGGSQVDAAEVASQLRFISLLMA